MKQGYLQVYTGSGKGKTTAALGLGLRAVGSGFKVIMFQFLKGIYSGEQDSVNMLDEKFKIIRLAESNKFIGALNDEEKEKLKEQLHRELEQVYEALQNKSCDILILDEIMAAIHGNLLTVDEVCALVEARPESMEMILTGRNAPRQILDRADLVTEMSCIKHYMDKGVPARKGIEK